MMIQMLDFEIQSPHHCTTGAISRHIKETTKKEFHFKKDYIESNHSLGLGVLYNSINCAAGKYNPAKKILQQDQL